MSPLHSQADATKETTVDPQALVIIKRASELLGDAKSSSFIAEIWEDVAVPDGPTVQVSRTVDIKMRRPDRLVIQKSSSEPERAFYYNGKELTVHDLKAGCYGSIKTPATIDAMVEAVAEKYDIALPIEDLIISKPFGDGAAKAKAGQYLGLDRVLGVTCHHVAFQNDNVEWQAWVDAGLLPVMRKVVITFKGGEDDEGNNETNDAAARGKDKEDKREKAKGPKQEEVANVVLEVEDGRDTHLAAIFSNWDFNAHLPDLVFEFTPPPDALNIEVLAVKTQE
ncbi:DUF2092 domain-containing protein [Verrucomicrobium spinosum]|uniref:DUF2092 domain-containing protein n=1 Tax=Verrucomicrobium spinosum TaxID=2736 RepID=UPI0001745078|nr:DUF2092 domain-containing protein [Verrucomicrobium spinosum]